MAAICSSKIERGINRSRGRYGPERESGPQDTWNLGSSGEELEFEMHKGGNPGVFLFI